jgi:uncharacterized protein RhaS with RHS repeats
MYMRNRYYDPRTGQFTQTDPIGLAGGLNAYGFAAGDPVSYSDPYGLKPEDVFVSCRPLDGNIGGAVGGHCAVRIVNKGVDVTYELLNINGIGNPQWAGVQTDPEKLAQYANGWVQVATPEGMTSDEHDRRTLAAADRLSNERNGRDYSPAGHKNSNRFVYDVVTQGGGRVPWAAVLFNRATPGICGGWGPLLGTNCSGNRNQGRYPP